MTVSYGSIFGKNSISAPFGINAQGNAVIGVNSISTPISISK